MSSFDTTNVLRYNSKKSWLTMGSIRFAKQIFGVSADVAKENGQSFTRLVNYRPIRRQE